MSRTHPTALAVLSALIAGAAASPGAAHPGAVLSPVAPPQPSPTAPQLPAEPGAGWSCSKARCTYVKTNGAAWASCFTSWAPSHRSWRPTTYCH